MYGLLQEVLSNDAYPLRFQGAKIGIFYKKSVKHLAYSQKHRTFATLLRKKARWKGFPTEIGIWCNWQHNRFWSCYSWFESEYPNYHKESGSIIASTLLLIPIFIITLLPSRCNQILRDFILIVSIGLHILITALLIQRLCIQQVTHRRDTCMVIVVIQT